MKWGVIDWVMFTIILIYVSFNSERNPEVNSKGEKL